MTMHRPLPLVLTILALAGAASAQVVPVQGGRELDANYQVGSYGVNSVRQSDRIQNANMYVTGQVGGMFGFHESRGRFGFVPPGTLITGQSSLVAPESLRLNLPSAGLDDFLRRSGGIPMVGGTFMPNGGYGATNYYSPSQTVLGARAIERGYNVPGSNIPKATYIPTQTAQQLYNSAMDAYKPAAPGIGEQMMVNTRVNPLVAPAGTTAVTGTSGAPNQAQPPVSYQYGGRPAASTLFGVIRRQDEQDKLIRDLGEADKANNRALGKPIDAQVDSAPPGTEPKTGTEKPNVPAAEPAMPQPGQDVFVDVLINMRKARQNKPPDKSAEADKTKPDTTKPPAQAVEVTENKVLINMLAGQNQDTFNQYMARGEKKLKAGKFYEAANDFDVAQTANHSNPLASMGQAMAMFGAGEPLTAALNLRRAMTIFPPIMETSMNFRRGLMDPALIATRTAQLEERIAEQKDQVDPLVVFLAVYVETSMGEHVKAARNAELLKSLAGQDELFKLYADYILTGKGPAPTTAPAGGAAGPATGR